MTAKSRDVQQLAFGVIACVCLVASTYYGAFLLRFAGELNSRWSDVFLSTVPWVVLVKVSCFCWFRLHKGWTRYLCFHDLLVLGQAISCAALGVTLVDAMCLGQTTIPRSVVLIDWGASLLAVGALRSLPRLVRGDAWHILARRGPTSLIVGANDSGATLLRAIRYHSALSFRVVGFVDDRSGVQRSRIEGVPVIGTCDDLPALTKRLQVEEVLITSGELAGKQVRRLVGMGQQHGFNVKVLPSYEQLLNGDVAVHPRSVAIEDLLGRSSVEIDLDGVRDWLQGRSVMVTGSAGSIGSEICRQLLKLRPARLVLVDRNETGQFYLENELKRLVHQRSQRNTNGRSSDSGLQSATVTSSSEIEIDTYLADLTDRERLEVVFREVRPEVVFHAAAYKHVPLMEAHCGEAVKNIVLATRNLVDLADAHGVQALVMISTDKAVNPTSVMGSCKRLAEQYVQARADDSRCRLVTVRFGNVLDSSGSVVPIFREQIAHGGPVTVTHPDITRFFMLIPEAAKLVIQAGAMGQGGEIFVLDMGEPVRILDLAHDLIRLSGLRVGDDVEVQVVGLRPGEKLFEELYDAGEVHQRTAHPKIMVAASARRSLLSVVHDIRRLEAMANEPNESVKRTLQQIVPQHEIADSTPGRAAA